MSQQGLKYTTEEVKSLFIKYEAVPLFEEYKGCSQKLYFKCSCGKEHFTTMSQLNKKRQRDDFKLLCRSCGVCRALKRPSTEERKRERELQFREHYKDSKSVILSYSLSSRNSRPKVRFICHQCGQEDEIFYKKERLKEDLICTTCFKRNKASQRENCISYTTEFVKDKLREAGVEPTFERYLNTGVPLTFTCKCGKSGEIKWTKFYQRGHIPRCPECHYKARQERGRYLSTLAPSLSPYTLEIVKEMIIKHGGTPTFTEYVNIDQRLPYICSCGKEAFTTLHKLNSRCRENPEFKLRCQACLFLINEARKEDKIFDQERAEQRCQIEKQKIYENKLKEDEEKFRERYKDSKSIIISYIPDLNGSNRSPKVKFICHVCKQETEIIYGYRKKKENEDLICSTCLRREKVSINSGAQYTTEFVKDKLREAGVKPLFERYINAYTPLPFICKCGQPGEITWGSFWGGYGTACCSECYKGVLFEITKRYSTQEVEGLFVRYGAIPTFKRYISVKQHLTYICSCGRESHITLDQFNMRRQRRGYRLLCRSCAAVFGKIPQVQKHFNEVIKPYFKEKEIDLLTTEYKNQNTRLKFTCKCGNIHDTTWGSISRGSLNKENWTELRCPSCSGSIRGKKRAKKTFENKIKPYFKSQGVQLLTTQYKNPFSRLDFECKCGNIHSTTWDSIISSDRGNSQGWRTLRCRECQIKAVHRGKDSPHWKGGTKDRGSVSRYWSNLILQLNNYICCISKQKGGKLSVHHLNAWAEYKEQRYNLNNGVCITKELHEEFHSTENYGKIGNNTLEQFQEFYRKKTGHEFKHIIPGNLKPEIIGSFLSSGALLDRKREDYERGVRYLPFFSSEVATKSKIVLSMIQNRSGLHIDKRYARKLKVKRITEFSKVAQFLNENHIQGSCPVGLNLALVDDQDNIKSLMCFKKRFSFGRGHYSLDRFCSLLNTVVVGGASKLFKYFIREYDPVEVVSYGDLRFSSYNPEETVYPKLGFKYTHTSKPNYWYTNDGINLYFRRTFQKKYLSKFFNKDIDLSLTEREIMEQEGYTRLYDCGNQVFVWNKELKE